MYAYVAGDSQLQGNPIHKTETEEREGSLTCEFERKRIVQRLALQPGERRGYWRYYAQRSYRQTIVHAQVDDRNARVLLDSGAEVSILDSTFARKAGIRVDTSEQLGCEGIGGSAFMTEGRASVKVTLAGELAYECQIWVGSLGNVDAILGCDFMTPAGIRLDLAEGIAL